MVVSRTVGAILTAVGAGVTVKCGVGYGAGRSGAAVGTGDGDEVGMTGTVAVREGNGGEAAVAG
jgi:hypothetical protein